MSKSDHLSGIGDIIGQRMKRVPIREEGNIVKHDLHVQFLISVPAASINLDELGHLMKAPILWRIERHQKKLDLNSPEASKATKASPKARAEGDTTGNLPLETPTTTAKDKSSGSRSRNKTKAKTKTKSKTKANPPAAGEGDGQ